MLCQRVEKSEKTLTFAEYKNVNDMIKRVFIVMCALVAISFSAVAQTKELSVREKMIELAKKYKDGNEVESFTFNKGIGLSTVKLALRNEMGKDFLKGIDMMIFISYDEAPAEMVAKLYKELEEVTKGLTRKDDPDEELIREQEEIDEMLEDEIEDEEYIDFMMGM